MKSERVASFWRIVAEAIRPNEWSSSLFGWEIKNLLLRGSGMTLGKGSAVAAGFWCNRGGERWITLGPGSGLGYEATVICNGKVRIGRGTTIAADSLLINWDSSQKGSGGALEIGNGCWIGAGATIIGPVCIGDFAIIGGGATVMADVPSGAIVAGIPAGLVRFRRLPKKQWYSAKLAFDTETMQLVPL